MRKQIVSSCLVWGLVLITFSACKKDNPVNQPQQPGNQNPPPVQPVETIKIKLQAVVTIGNLNYDSIPAQFTIFSWDTNHVFYRKDTLLPPGVNEVSVPKSHTMFRFSLNKWGIKDSIQLRKDQLQTDVVYTLGGSRAPKKLAKEESFLLVGDTYQPSSKTLYAYNANGISSVSFYQKKPQFSDLQFTHKHVYSYQGLNVNRIDFTDEDQQPVGFIDFTYNAQGNKITHMHQKSYDVETFAAVEHRFPAGTAEINIDYLYNNGQALSYQMQMRRGDKIADQAFSSTGSGENGTYQYDAAINPYAHMNMPDLFLANLSKNNLLSQQKNFAGNVPGAIVYKHDYVYNSEGYPVEVIRHYKSYLTGEHLYKIKTVYTYL